MCLGQKGNWSSSVKNMTWFLDFASPSGFFSTTATSVYSGHSVGCISSFDLAACWCWKCNRGSRTARRRNWRFVEGLSLQLCACPEFSKPPVFDSDHTKCFKSTVKLCECRISNWIQCIIVCVSVCVHVCCRSRRMRVRPRKRPLVSRPEPTTLPPMRFTYLL